MNHNKRPRYSLAEKGKNLRIEEPQELQQPDYLHQFEEPEELGQPDYLHLKIFGSLDVDNDFRHVTSDRFYGVKAWVHPDKVFSTMFNRPDYYRKRLDPEWGEQVRILIDEFVKVEDLYLHLELMRAVKMCDYDKITEPGPSSMMIVVGRVRMGLDGLGKNTWHQKMLRLMLRDLVSGGWKSQGAIFVEVKLQYIP